MSRKNRIDAVVTDGQAPVETAAIETQNEVEVVKPEVQVKPEAPVVNLDEKMAKAETQLTGIQAVIEARIRARGRK